MLNLRTRHRAPSKISGHASWFQLAVAGSGGMRDGFAFMMHVRATQKWHSIENVFLEPFEPQINHRRHEKRDHLRED